jgi:hypothetical protein
MAISMPALGDRDFVQLNPPTARSYFCEHVARKRAQEFASLRGIAEQLAVDSQRSSDPR